jgi:hypothetical protein
MTEFEKYQDAILKQFNSFMTAPDRNPADKYDQYFQAYLIGSLSALISNEKYAQHTAFVLSELEKGNG